MKTETITKRKEMSHVEYAQRMAGLQAGIICEMFDWTLEQYFEHQLDEYEAFLKRVYFGRPVDQLNAVRYSPLFAGFWKMEWMNRNKSLILPFAEDILQDQTVIDEHGALKLMPPDQAAIDNVYDEYAFVHSHRTLVNCESFMAKYSYVLSLVIRD